MGGFATYDKGLGVLGTTVYADNVDFTGTGRTNTITTNGQLLIGATTANAGGNHINVGTITSPDSSLTIGFSSPNITLSVAGGTTVGKTITGDIGGPISPVAGNWNILGTTVPAASTPIQTSGSGNTLSIQVQRSQALAAADSTKVGLSNFNSTQFSVTATGFVSIVGGGFTWTDVTGATQTLAVENGYLTDRGAGVTYTLPATASIGDTIKIVGKLGLATITPNANQQILIGSASGAVGVTGTAVSTNLGDCIELICTTSGASTVWRAGSVVGNWTLNFCKCHKRLKFRFSEYFWNYGMGDT